MQKQVLKLLTNCFNKHVCFIDFQTFFFTKWGFSNNYPMKNVSFFHFPNYLYFKKYIFHSLKNN